MRVDIPTLAHRTAIAALIAALPSTIWRVLMLLGVLPDTAAFRAEFADEIWYVVGLSVVELAAAAAVVWLARGGFRSVTATLHLPRWLPAAAGIVGGLVITWMFTIEMPIGLVDGRRPDQGLVTGTGLVIMIAAYAPLLVWGPLTVAASALSIPGHNSHVYGHRTGIRA